MRNKQNVQKNPILVHAAASVLAGGGEVYGLGGRKGSAEWIVSGVLACCCLRPLDESPAAALRVDFPEALRFVSLETDVRKRLEGNRVPCSTTHLGDDTERSQEQGNQNRHKPVYLHITNRASVSVRSLATLGDNWAYRAIDSSVSALIGGAVKEERLTRKCCST